MPRLTLHKSATAAYRQALFLLQQLYRELLSPARRRQRSLDEVETVLSVALAIGIAHLVGAQNVGWAAFSGYMVMRAQLADSLSRGFFRVMGTILGAAAAWLLHEWLAGSLLLMSLALAVIGGGALYAAITRPHSYAWLFTSLTFSMVTLDALGEPAAHVHDFVLTRILEVSSGTVACLIVNVVFAISIRPRVHGPQHFFTPHPHEVRPIWHNQAARHAGVAAFALALLPILSSTLNPELLSQAAITITAVMMIPLSALVDGRHVVTTRVVHRFAGCLLGAVMAALALLFSHGNLPATLLFMVLGVAAGRHIENSNQPFAYVGTQFALVFLVVFVPDNYNFVASSPGWLRLAGIVLGLVALLLVRECTRWIPRER